MRIVAFGKKNPRSICLNDGKEDVWFYISDRAKIDITTLQKDDEVDIEFTEGTKGGKFISVLTVKNGTPVTAKPSTTSSEKKPFVPYSGKSPEEQNSIKRQAIGHMVSRTIIGLQGTVDINNVTAVIDTLYKKYVEVVG